MLDKSITVGILGAGGKMGMRIGANLKSLPNPIYYIENAPAGITRLQEAGLEASDPEEVLQQVDILIFAVPDTLIGQISQSIVPKVKDGASIIMLDAAAPYMKQVKMRDTVHYIVCHPCHPALFKKQPTDAGYHDHFGGIDGLQDIVATNLQGSEAAYQNALEVIREMFAPVDQIFDMTIEQMAFLEPTAVEVVGLSVASVIKETVDILVEEKGIAREAAKSFVLGHVKIELAIMLEGSNPLSDAATIALQESYPEIIQPSWRNVFQKSELDKILKKMLDI